MVCDDMQSALRQPQNKVYQGLTFFIKEYILNLGVFSSM